MKYRRFGRNAEGVREAEPANVGLAYFAIGVAAKRIIFLSFFAVLLAAFFLGSLRGRVAEIFLLFLGFGRGVLGGGAAGLSDVGTCTTVSASADALSVANLRAAFCFSSAAFFHLRFAISQPFDEYRRRFVYRGLAAQPLPERDRFRPYPLRAE